MIVRNWCEKLALSTRSAILAGVQQSARTADASDNNSTVIPWPGAFSLVGDKDIADKAEAYISRSGMSKARALTVGRA